MGGTPQPQSHRRDHLDTRHDRQHGGDDAGSTDDIELTEQRMRRALGLDGSTLPSSTADRTETARPNIPHGIKPPHASQDSARSQNHSSRSESPSLLRQRLATLERQLTEERGHHDQSRHQLEQAQRVLAELEARVQRVALDQADQLDVEHQATMRAQRELEELLSERDRLRQAAPPATAQAAAEPEPARSRSELRSRPRLHAASEPKPVRWWTPSYRARAKSKR